MFSQTAEYALRSMSWLALTPEMLVPTGDLADATKVPPHYLAKVLQQMAAAQLITGRRGVGGGYKLARDPSEITLREVISAITPIQRITSCPLGVTERCENLCPVHSLIDSIAASVLEALEGKTLADMVRQPSHPTPLCDTGSGGAAAGVGAGRMVPVLINGTSNGTAKR